VEKHDDCVAPRRFCEQSGTPTDGARHNPVCFGGEASVRTGDAYPIGLDDGSTIAKSYGLTGLPGTVFITRDGNLPRRLSGIVSADQLASLVDAVAR